MLPRTSKLELCPLVLRSGGVRVLLLQDAAIVHCLCQQRAIYPREGVVDGQDNPAQAFRTFTMANDRSFFSLLRREGRGSVQADRRSRHYGAGCPLSPVPWLEGGFSSCSGTLARFRAETQADDAPPLRRSTKLPCYPFSRKEHIVQSSPSSREQCLSGRRDRGGTVTCV